MLLALLTACLPPTTFGIRSDGTIGAPRSVELSAGAGAVLPEDGADGVAALGGQAAYALARDVAITGAAAWIPSAEAVGLELGARTRLLGEEATSSLTSVEGLSSIRGSGGDPIHGAQLGLIGSLRPTGPVRPYLGLLVNPTWSNGDHWFYSDLGVGATLSAPASERVEMRCTLEVDWNRDWTDDYSSFGGLLLAGVRVR